MGRIRKLVHLQGRNFAAMDKGSYENGRRRKMTDYKKLIVALQTIQDECRKYDCGCLKCPLYNEDSEECGIRAIPPADWNIKDIDVIRLLESE